MEGHTDTEIRALSLVDLISRVVNHSDREALTEFHAHRTIFAFGSARGLLFVEFLDYLRQACSAGRDACYAEDAYTLTLDKFNRLPAFGARRDTAVERHGSNIDCRNYFRAFLADVRRRHATAAQSVIEEELSAARVLEGLVWTHFNRSIAESRRAASDMTRYVWVLRHGSVTVHMPRGFSGRARRRWLVENVPDADPLRSGEQDRIQTIIDTAFPRSTLDPEEAREGAVRSTWRHTQSSDIGEGSFVRDLTLAVAEEKVERISEQRDSIRELGPFKLRQMIIEIFASANEGSVDPSIARRFGLSTITFSRFAGTRWKARTSIPDLWANTARLLASDSDFSDVVRDAGLWSRVQMLAGPNVRTARRTSP